MKAIVIINEAIVIINEAIVIAAWLKPQSILHTSHFLVNWSGKRPVVHHSTLPMIRFLKWFFPISMAVLIVVVAGAYWYVTPERLKTIVQPHLSAALGREVMFDRINWGLFDGVVFSGLRVEGRDGSDPFLIAERAQVHMSRWRLLSVLGALVLRGAVPGMDEQGDAEDSPSEMDVFLPLDRVQFQDGTLRVRRIAIVFDHLEMDLYLQDGRLHVEQIQGQTCEGTLEGSLVWDNGAWDGAVSLVNAQAEQVVRSIGWGIPLYGEVGVTVNILDGAVASGTAIMAEGRIVRWDFLQRLLHPMAQWGLLPADEIPLKDVTVVFQVQGDEVILDGTKFTALDMACQVNGKSTRKGQLDYVLDVEMPIQFAGFQLGRAVPIRVKITGTADAPEVMVAIRH